MSRLCAAYCVVVLLVAFLLSPGCYRSSVPSTIVYNEHWSSDFAANGAWVRCNDGRPEGALRICQDDAKKEEAEFLRKFSAAFQSDPTCTGLVLLVVGPNNETSEQAQHASTKLEAGEHWILFVDFSPGLERQSWIMTHQPHGDRRTSGEGDASSMARSVWGIAKNRGGTVVD